MSRYRNVFKVLIVAGVGLLMIHAFNSMRAQTCPLDPFAPADLYPCGSEI
jgi:hypothetical protein